LTIFPKSRETQGSICSNRQALVNVEGVTGGKECGKVRDESGSGSGWNLARSHLSDTKRKEEKDMEEENKTPLDGEMCAMNIIANSGDARSKAFGALEAAKAGDFEEADRLLEEAKACGQKAHNAQTELLFADAQGLAPAMNVLLVHAQDHFMTSMLAEELIREIILLYKDRAGK